MKKYLFLLAAVFGITSAYGEGVILSDTYVADEDNDVATAEEPFVAPQTTNSYNSQKSSQTVKNPLLTDSSDPLFLVADNHFLTDTYITTVDEKIRFGEHISYGVTSDLVLDVNMLYQWDVSGRKESGFSSTEIGGIYRMNRGLDTNHIIYDALFGLKVGGSSHVRTPEYANSSYFAGLRLGRQFTGLTLSGTIKSTWVFDDTRGLSYIDFIPEAYFRFPDDFRAGLGFDIRKSTSPIYLRNQEWVNFKLLRQYGNTQYVGHIGYEFEKTEFQFGADVKILF